MYFGLVFFFVLDFLFQCAFLLTIEFALNLDAFAFATACAPDAIAIAPTRSRWWMPAVSCCFQRCFLVCQTTSGRHCPISPLAVTIPQEWAMTRFLRLFTTSLWGYYECKLQYLFIILLFSGLQSREDRSKGFFEVSMPDSEKDINEEEIDEEVKLILYWSTSRLSKCTELGLMKI